MVEQVNRDRLPLALQAIMATFVPVMFSAAFVVIWGAVTWSESAPETSHSPAIYVIPILQIAACAWVQYQFIKRTMLVGVIEAGSPAVATVLSIAGAIAGVAFLFYFPGIPVSRTGLNRNAMGFNTFFALFLTWLGAFAGLLVYRRSPAP